MGGREGGRERERERERKREKEKECNKVWEGEREMDGLREGEGENGVRKKESERGKE